MRQRFPINIPWPRGRLGIALRAAVSILLVVGGFWLISALASKPYAWWWDPLMFVIGLGIAVGIAGLALPFRKP